MLVTVKHDVDAILLEQGRVDGVQLDAVGELRLRRSHPAEDATVLAVGGAAFLVPDALTGVHKVERVVHGECANAVGAAIAQVSGEVDQVFQNMSREQAIAAAEGLPNKEPSSYSLPFYEDSTTGQEPVCVKSAAPDFYASNKISQGTVTKYGKPS